MFFFVTDDTRTCWKIECPDGQILTLKKDTGLCDRFPYHDIKEHKEAIAMIQIVRDNYEGYTKREVKEAMAEVGEVVDVAVVVGGRLFWMERWRTSSKQFGCRT